MGKIVGAGLKGVTSLLYLLAFCAAGIVIGIWSYFLAKLAIHNLGINTQTKAIEGLAGCAVIYTFFAALMTCCLGGRSFFAILGILGDLLIMGAFIAIAVLDRAGAGSRTGRVNTPLGNGNSVTNSASGTNLGLAARLNTTVFACAVAGAGLMFLTLLFNIFQWINHRKEKHQGPSPDNDYTSGSGKQGGLFARRNKPVVEPYNNDKDVETAGVIPAITHVEPRQPVVRDTVRPSYDTDATLARNDNAPTKYEAPVAPVPQVPAVTTTHYVTPGVYDPNYNPEGTSTNLRY